MDGKIFKTRTRILNLFDRVASSNWRRPGLRKIGEIPEVRQLRRHFKKLEQMKGQQND